MKLIKKYENGGSPQDWRTALAGFMQSSGYGMIAQRVDGMLQRFPTPNADLNSNNQMAANARGTISNTLLSSGNPYAMAAGVAITALDKTGGFSDVSKGLGGGTDALNAISSFIPGMGYLLNKKKTDDYKMSADMQVMQNGYAGTTQNAHNAEANAGAKLLFGRDKANMMIEDAKLKDNIIQGIKQNSDADYLQMASMTQNKAMQNAYGLRGGYIQNYTRYGQLGMKINKIKQLSLQIKFKEPKEINKEEIYVMKDGGQFFQDLVFKPTTKEQDDSFFSTLFTTEEIQKFQSGGKTTPKTDEERIKYLIETVIKPAAESGNSTARRLMDLDPNEYTFSDMDVTNGYHGKAGDKGNVYLGNQDNYIVPGIQYVNDKLEFIPNPYKRGINDQWIEFPSEEDARFFGENYHNYPYLTPALAKHEPKRVKSDKSYYDKDSDSIYYNNDEAFEHEYFHARPNQNFLELLREYYEDLDDEKIKKLGGDLAFVKRFDNDPNYFYSPEELGARIRAAKYMTKGLQYSPEFFRELRGNENKYGDNMRDLLHMYNDENLSKIFNIGNLQQFKEGGQMNVIPEGSLHARLHHMENAENFTKKGIPVIDNNGEQQAEIEKSEIIFNKETTEKLEELCKKFNSDEYTNKEKENFAIEAGKLLSVQIMENTDDRVGLLNNEQ